MSRRGKNIDLSMFTHPGAPPEGLPWSELPAAATNGNGAEVLGSPVEVATEVEFEEVLADVKNGTVIFDETDVSFSLPRKRSKGRQSQEQIDRHGIEVRAFCRTI